MTQTSDTVTLKRATCLTEGHTTTQPADMAVPGPIQEIGEPEMMQRLPGSAAMLSRKTPIDFVAVMDAFDRYNGPNFFSGRFVVDADDKVYACDREEQRATGSSPVDRFLHALSEAGL